MSVESESMKGPGSKKSSVRLQSSKSVIYFVFTVTRRIPLKKTFDVSDFRSVINGRDYRCCR